MPKLRECVYERSPITNLSLRKDNTLAYTTQFAGAKIIDSRRCSQVEKIVLKELNVKSISPCFSPDDKQLAFANNQTIYIVALESKKIVKTIRLNISQVTALTFSSDSLYVIVATNKGRILQYRCDSSSLLARLYSLPYNSYTKSSHYVKKFATHKNKLVCSATDGSLILIDLDLQKKKSILIKEGVEINAILFVDETHLISADNAGVVKIHNLLHKADLKTLNAPFKDITSIALTNNAKTALISSPTSNFIAAIDIVKGVVLKSNYIESEEYVQSIVINKANILYAVTQEAHIEKIQLAVSQDLKILINKNAFIEAYQLIKKEPLLRTDTEFELLEQKYQEVYMQILHALADQNKTQAMKLIKIVQGVSEKEKEINSLLLAFKYYNDFKMKYIQKKHTLAYAIVHKHPPLQHTSIYQQLEEKYLKAFVSAKRHVELNNIPSAKALLNEYFTVHAKRPIIKLLLAKNTDFFKFLRAVEKKDFQIQEEMVAQNKVYTLAPTYTPSEKSIEKGIQAIEDFIKEGDLTQAKELLLKFKSTPYMKVHLIRLSMKMQKMHNFQKSYKANNFKVCYELLDMNHFLQETKLGSMLTQHWHKLLVNAETIALSGNLEKVLTLLEDFIHIKTRKNKIGNVLRVASLAKVKLYLSQKKYEEAQKTIYSHIDVFGRDSEVFIMMDQFEALSKEKLAIICDEGIHRDDWLKIDILEKYTTI